MKAYLFSENIDIACCQEKAISDKNDVASIPIRTYVEEKDIPTVAKDFSKLLYSHEPTTGLNMPTKILTSAITTFDYPIKFPERQQYEMSRDAEDFINRQKKAVRYREEILAVSDKALEFLKKEGIPVKISISLFTDPEYSDWIEPKIRIEVPKDEVKRTYDLYNKLLGYSLRGISKKTMKKLFVTVEAT